MIQVVHAHPYPNRSRAGAALLAAIADAPSLEVRSLYRLYPDFDIDATTERKALEGARLLVLLHPVFWYSAPALLKHWLDVVFVKGWAHGDGGTALTGKACLWAVTTGGDEHAYTSAGRHGEPFADFIPVMERTARYCGMRWLEPFVLYGAHAVSDEALGEAGRRLRERIVDVT